MWLVFDIAVRLGNHNLINHRLNTTLRINDAVCIV